MTASKTLRLFSHYLCPYVQRAVIALDEKGVAHERTYIDLAAKPDWFTALSPLGKVPLLLVDETTALFESAVICEFLEETAPGVRLHPDDPVERAPAPGLDRVRLGYAQLHRRPICSVQRGCVRAEACRPRGQDGLPGGNA
jgi:glutathione S-transferase